MIEKGEYNPEDECGDAVRHTRAMMDVVDDVATAGAIKDLSDQISSADEWNELFVLVGQEEKPVDEEQRS